MRAEWLVPGDEDRMEAAVREAELQTAAELVVVVARRGEEYRDVPLYAAMAAAVAALAFMLYSPILFNELLILPDALLVGLAAVWTARRTPALARLCTCTERRRRAAERAAHLAFVDHGVTATKDRTGILVHYTALERRLTILADFGVQGKVPAARFHAIVSQFEKDRVGDGLGPALAAAIRAVGPAVAKEVPHQADDVNELPDRPRVDA